MSPAPRAAESMTTQQPPGNAQVAARSALPPSPGVSALWMYAVAVAFGLVQLAYLIPVDVLTGTGSYWQNLRADAQVGVIGMRYFLADDWHFPLTVTRLLMAPEGVSVVYTDSIPLLALLTKALRPVLPDGVNYLGVWLAIAFVLQGVGAMSLLRSLQVRSVLAQIVGVVLAISMPAFLFRAPLHASLIGHFLILFALSLYVRSCRPLRARWGPFVFLVGISLLIHAYLFVMVGGIFAAAWLRRLFHHSDERGRLAGVAFGVSATVALVLWSAGYLVGGGGSSGFGHYSMNLLAPWIPQRSGLIPGPQPIIDATGGQHEGFNYLGAGVLLLGTWGLAIQRRSCVAMLSRHWVLAVVLASFTALAVSHRAFVGHTLLFELPAGGEPTLVSDAFSDRVAAPTARDAASQASGITSMAKAALQQFRSSGRFFWPVAYVLLVFGVTAAERGPQGAANSAVLLLAAGLQLVDTAPLRDEIRTKYGGEVSMSALPASMLFPPDSRWDDPVIAGPAWEAFIGAHETLTVVPAFECAGLAERWHVLDLVFAASATATPSNTTYLARRRETRDCVEASTAQADRPPAPGELQVFLTSSLPASTATGILDSPSMCRSFSLGMACTTHWPNVLPEALTSTSAVSSAGG